MSDSTRRSQEDAEELESYAEQEHRSLRDRSGDALRAEADGVEEPERRADPLSAPAGDLDDPARTRADDNADDTIDTADNDTD